MIIQHNLTAMNSNRMMGLTKSRKAKTTEKLSSGYRINRSADDAAGLAISEKMRRQIRGLTQAAYNCQDGVSLCQIADGALNEVHEMLKRSEELVVQALNGTNTAQDREYIQKELDAIYNEIDRVHTTTVFNEQNIFSENGAVPYFIQTEDIAKPDVLFGEEGDVIISSPLGNSITLSFVDGEGNRILTPQETQAVGSVNPDEIKNSSLAKFVQKAATNAASLLAEKYPKLFGKASTNNIQIGLQLMDIDGEHGVLASASKAYTTSNDSAILSYSMSIDISDYAIDEFDGFDDEKKSDLAAVIAHEMTHLITYDTIIRDSFNTDWSYDNESFSPLQQWFTEGIAQTSSGDNGWFYLDSDSTDEEIKSYMSELISSYKDSGSLGSYGAGYAATMYLGMLASGEDMNNVTSSNIAKGLDNLMSFMVPDPTDYHARTLGDAINEYTPYSGLTNFVESFRAADSESFNFIKNLISARGENGAGSILYDLNTPEDTAFSPSSLTRSYNSYKINADNRWYANTFGDITEIPDDYFVPDSPKRPRNNGGGGYGGGDGSGFSIQAGSEAGQVIHINQFNISARALFGDERIDITGDYREQENTDNNISFTTQDNASSRSNALNIIENADRRVSMIRAYYGATQNRLEHTINNLNNVVENTTAAESQMRDTDMATMMVQYARDNILEQAGQTILAQANQSKQGILSLLQG